MAGRTLVLTTPGRLSIERGQLKYVREGVSPEETVRTFPVEDLGFVVLESGAISMTIPVMRELLKHHVALIVCDERHMPCGMLENLDGNRLQQKVVEAQLAASAPLKKQLWQQCVKAKIRNQAALLREMGLRADAVENCIRYVKSGDTDNREGVAAKLYWNELFSGKFKRSRFGEEPNSGFNYGYALLRAATARALTGSGLLCVVGIHHGNQYNSFGLADDIMEAYRPYIDRTVLEMIGSGQYEEGLPPDVKKNLLRSLDSDVKIGRCLRPLQNALSITSASLAESFLTGKNRLVLPEY